MNTHMVVGRCAFMLVKIEPKYKKCVVELEWFNREDGVVAEQETLWRWGTFYAQLTESQYEDLVEQSSEDDWKMNTEISALPEWEYEEAWDGISCDVDIYGKDEEAVEYTKQKLESEIEEMHYDYFEWFEKNGFEQTGELEIWIIGPLVLEVVG